MKPEINFPYVANQKAKPSYNIWKGVALSIMTAMCITMILIFALVPGAAEMFDKHADYMVAMNTMYLVIAVGATLLGLILAFKKD